MKEERSLPDSLLAPCTMVVYMVMLILNKRKSHVLVVLVWKQRQGKLAFSSLPCDGAKLCMNNYQLLDEVEQNITICRWRADQLFADAEGRGK